MNCLKCGRELTNDGAFCADCLLEMEKYPVDPGAVVLLPRRRENYIQKKQMKRHAPSPEELVVSLRKWVIALILLLMACIVAIILMFEPTMHYVRDEHFEIGQNYSSVTPSQSSNTPTPAE